MYERNLVHFIRQIRHEFQVSSTVPFVLATLGQTSSTSSSSSSSTNTTDQNDKLIFNAMLAVSDPQQYPEFAANVATVYTHPLAQGGTSNGHYNHNAEVFMDVGEAMGHTMVQLSREKNQTQVQ
jgi:hypothetical protein